jgi:PD-(D/E)XK endonuclease
VRTPREQGDWGERSAIIWLLQRGAAVFAPVGHSRDVDLIAVFDGPALRVQVKSCRRRQGDRWHVMLCTRGGNQSWNGLVKRLDAARYEYLFVAVANGRRWWIPSRIVGGGTGLLLGGPKYSAYEVEPGPAMPGAQFLDSDAIRGDSGAVKRTRL